MSQLIGCILEVTGWVGGEGHQPQLWVSECAVGASGHYRASLSCDIFGQKSYWALFNTSTLKLTRFP